MSLRNILGLVFIVLSFLVKAQEEVQPFLPDTFSKFINVRDIAITPNGDEIYFTLDSHKSEIGAIAFIEKKDMRWSDPKVVSFSGNYRDLEPAFSTDGQTLYFASNRPVHKDSVAPGDYNIWKVTRQGNGWSSAQVLGPEINTGHNEFYPSIAQNGNLYFTSDRPSEVGRENIYVSEFSNGANQEAVALGAGVNSKYYEFNAYVAPDESFLLFSAIRPNEGQGGGDLYISFNQDGWQKAEPLKLINTPYLDFCPFVDLKNGVLYFTSQRTAVKIYSKRALQANYFSNLKRSTQPKGLNRIYSIDLKKTLPEK